jgi:hypothetical protein
LSVVKKEAIDRYSSCFLLLTLLPLQSPDSQCGKIINKLLPINTLILKKEKFDVELIKVLGEEQPQTNIVINNIFRHKYGWVDSH